MVPPTGEPSDRAKSSTSDDITEPSSHQADKSTIAQDADGEQRHRNDKGKNEDNDDEDDEEEEEEPLLKYTRLTSSLGNVYRNGDATSAALVAGDKLVLGTHNGNIHILSLPSLHPLRTYHAHTASITSISVSPPIPPPSSHAHSDPSTVTNLSTPLHLATSSLDGHTCVTDPQDSKDTSRTNFSRPVSAIALSPTYKHDRIFLSGGLAGNLICSRAAQNSSSSTAGQGGSSWLPWSGGPKDTIIHSGEGPISGISWSKVSPRFVVWANEKGIKIMRSHITTFKGDRVERAGEWRRISAIERPSEVPEDMATSWKVRMEWIDLTALEKDAEIAAENDGKEMIKKPPPPKKLKGGGKERLIVGWGGVIWVIDVYGGDGLITYHSPAPNGRGRATESNEGKAWGWAEIRNVISTDCIIAGLTMYKPLEVLLLAYLTGSDESEEDTENKQQRSDSPPRRRIPHRSNALSPEVRIIDLNTASEINAVSLLVSRYESLAASDYHLCYIPPAPQKLKPKAQSSKLSNVLNSPPASAAETGYGGALWAAGLNATTLFSSGASMMSRRDSFSTETARSTPTSSIKGLAASVLSKGKAGMAGREEVPGWKIYIASPYDCVFATERGKKDKLTWLLEKKNFAGAWTLIDEHPDIVIDSDQMEEEEESDDTSTIAGSFTSSRNIYSVSEKEKRRIGEYWIETLINDEKWEEAGEICGKVLGTSSRWEHWIWVFFGANKVKEITPYIPTRTFRPPLPSLIYEYVLKEYLNTDRKRLEELINMWPEGLYDENAVVIAIQDKLKTRGEPGLEKGSKDWRRLHECLATLYMRADQHKSALLEQILLKNADSAIGLVRAYKLLDGIQGYIRDWILLRMSDKTFKIGSREDWERETQETIDLLVDESYEHEGRGLSIHDVVTELQDSENNQQLLFFYLREIWNRDQNGNFGGTGGRIRVIEFDDLMVELFAEYDRPLLMQFLKTSQNYSYEKASQICEARKYIPELVHLLSTTGQTKRALNLIIDKLNDVAMAIDFAKTQDDPDLWNDLLNYSMNKPAFIRGLLENVGTAIDPIKLIKRIPEGLEIEGLKDGCARILREYEIQYSISEGVAKVFRGEVAQGMERLRSGRRRGVKFDVHAELRKPPSVVSTGKDDISTAKSGVNPVVKDKKNGCGICSLLFKMDEDATLIAFACGHVFHLGCLLKHSKSKIKPNESNDPGSSLDEMDEVEALLLKKRRQSNAGDVEGANSPAVSGPSGFRASVAEKITRAALIKERVKGGCPLETRDD